MDEGFTSWCAETGANIGVTCFGEVSQGAAEGAPLQAFSHGVSVIQTGAVHAPVAGLLLQAGALRHAGPHHPLLLLQLRCGEEPGERLK